MINRIVEKVTGYTLYTLMVSALWLGACNADDGPDPGKQPDFAVEGLEGRIIRQLVNFGNEIFAATDDGLYVKDITGTGGWQSHGLTGITLSSFVKVNDDYWLAAGFDFDPEADDFPLYVSTNQGTGWELLENGFGGEDSERINAMDYDPESNTLFAAGVLVAASSNDYGVTWTPEFGEWGSFGTGMSIVKYQEDKNTLWTGGQNAIEELVLIRHDLTTGEDMQWSNLLPAPSVSKSILFGPDDPEHIVIGAEGGIVETRDGGDNWSELIHLDDSRFFFGMAFDHENPDIIYAAGWLKNFDFPQELRLFYSVNGGQDWENRVFGDDELFGGAWGMVSVIENGQQVLYVALYKGGIARIQLNDMVK